MKLAEALQIRSDLQRKTEEIRMRLSNNATVQEGEEPSEDPVKLLEELDRTVNELERLIGRINLSNALIRKDGKTLTELLAKRDCLKMQLSVYRDFLFEAGQISNRVRGSEIKIRSTVPISIIQKEVDRKAAELRRLELTLQEINWIFDLSE